MRDLPEELAAEFVAAGSAPPGQVLADLPAMLAQFEAFQPRLTDLVARRLGEQADDEVPAMVAAVALTAIRQGMERWARTPGEECPVPYVERSTALLHSLLANSGARP